MTIWFCGIRPPRGYHNDCIEVTPFSDKHDYLIMNDLVVCPDM